MHNLPVPGRDYQATLGISQPTARDRALEGPVTLWHANGKLMAHGRFAVDPGGRSVPDGLWSFWYPNGRRQSVALYSGGEVVGCFTRWSLEGEVETLTVRGGQAYADSCQSLLDPEAEAIASEYGNQSSRAATVLPPPVAVIELGSTYSPSNIEIAGDELRGVDGDLGFSYWFGLYHHWDRLTIGATHRQYWTSSDGTTMISFAVVPGARYPLGRWVSLEGGLELGVRGYNTRPASADEEWLAIHRMLLWTGFAGLRGGAEVRVTDYLSVYLGGFVEVDLARDKTESLAFSNGFEISDFEVTARAGGNTIAGMLLALRLDVR